MGSVLNTAGAAEIAAELACCACSSVCGFICKDQATRAKLRYCTLLLSATIMCFVMLIPGMRRNLDRIPNLCGKAVTRETCDQFFGFGAVYRIMLSMTCFYSVFAIFTIRITKVNSFRAKFNNGFWIIKLLLLVGITIGTFFIPKKSEFFRIWMYAGLIGGFIFMLYQIMLIIDFGHSWSISWAERLETSNAKLWYLAMIIATLLMFIISIATITGFYYLFAGSFSLTKCKANMFYITFIVIQCLLATIVSVTPTVQQELEGAGLLQSSVVVLYASYLTWNTLSSEPDPVCNPLGKVILDYDTMSGIDGAALFGCLLTFALIIFACVVRAHTSHLGQYGLALSEGEEYAIATFMNEKRKQKSDVENEMTLDDFVGYNYSLFHIVMTLASLYILMILTNWHSPEHKSNMRRLVKNWASVWVQMASSFLCVLIYVWFLVTPLIKKVWGPLFGISFNDSRNRGKSSKGQSSSGQDSKVQSSKVESNKDQSSKSDGSKDKDQSSTFPSLQNKNDNSVDIRKRIIDNKNSEGVQNKQPTTGLQRFSSIESLRSVLSSRPKKKKATYETKERERLQLNNENSEESIITEFSAAEEGRLRNRRQSRLRRFASIESLKSGLSAISTATSQVKRKLKKRLKRGDKMDRLQEAKTSENDVSRESRFETSRDHSESFHSKLERSRKRGGSKIGQCKIETESRNGGKDDGVRRTPTENDVKVNNEQISNENKDKKPVDCQKIDDEGLRKEISHVGHEKSAFEKAIKDNEKALEFNDALLTHSSVHNPSIFSRKPQDPEVAREILKLQWKILRMQAKVVKIQEKIIRLQAENDIVKNNLQDVADKMEPPVGQSSAVAGGVYSRRIEVIKGMNRKEPG